MIIISIHIHGCLFGDYISSLVFNSLRQAAKLHPEATACLVQNRVAKSPVFGLLKVMSKQHLSLLGKQNVYHGVGPHIDLRGKKGRRECMPRAQPMALKEQATKPNL